MYKLVLSHGSLKYKSSLQINAEIKIERQRKSTSIIRSSIIAPNIDERDTFSHFPIRTARATSPSLGTRQFTAYPTISEPNKFFIEMSGLTERRIIFHRTARKKCERSKVIIKITIQKIDAPETTSSTSPKFTL